MFNQKAFDILDSSINSIVFIDDQAKDFFSGTPVDNNIPEEKLSVDLFNTFKENGKSLAIHKFDVSNLQNNNTLDYLFKGRDLILLDWELAGVAGQEHSLKLLSHALKTPHINFCCIYSSSNNFNEIPLFLDAYFSGINKMEFQQLQDSYSHIELDEIQDVWNGSEEEIDTFLAENEIDLEDLPLEKLKSKSKYMILRYIFISLASDKYIIPDISESEYEIFNAGSDSFIINNTFILPLKKDTKADSNYQNLFVRISEAVIKNKGSFFQLLGLEMQSIFNSNERFIDDNILKSSTEALFQFRNHINDDKIFGSIIKNLLLEQASLKLRTAKLKLLDSEFLAHESKELESLQINHEDLFQLNVFHNSVTVKSLNSDDTPNLNFGDIFKGSLDDYYLCITALCDCYEPRKIDYNFYFVQGTVFDDIELALILGDTAFISFLPNGKAIYWGNLDDPQIKKIKEPTLSNSEDDPKKLKNDIETLKQLVKNLSSNQSKLNSFLYKPFYIKPKVYNVQNNKLINNKMRIWDITNKFTKEEFDQNLNYFDVEYITTLRNDYTQRIANHAFGHSVRVGVDFVKIK